VRTLLAVLTLVSAPALAWPIDVSVEVEPGKETFVKLAAVEWLEVEDPKVASAEWLAESGELLVSGLKAGSTLMLLYAEGNFAVWRIRVGGPRRVSSVDAVKKAAAACPGLTLHPEQYDKVVGPVADPKCRDALLPAFKEDGVLARELDLTFEPKVLEAQLRQMRDDVKKLPVTLSYVGASLKLDGTLTARQHREVLWAVFRRAVGRVPLEDRVEISDRSVDAGAPALTAPVEVGVEVQTTPPIDGGVRRKK
jgi:hypothetical protein